MRRKPNPEGEGGVRARKRDDGQEEVR
jgi:hypothetical protein